jgi:hypothetical protein
MIIKYKKEKVEVPGSFLLHTQIKIKQMIN